MISVTLFATVAGRSRSKRRNFEAPYQEGMTTLDIISSEFSDQDLGSIMVMVNGKHVPKETALHDGDSVALALILSGG